MSIFAKLSCLTLGLLAMVSCNQKEFERLATEGGCRYYLKADYDRPWYLLYEGGTDWKAVWNVEEYHMQYDSLIPEIPKGLRVLVYDFEENRYNNYDIHNLDPFGGEFMVQPGKHTLLMYNNDTEYIIFDNLNDSAMATASTRARSRSAYVASKYVPAQVADNTITPPDMLYACYGGEIYGEKSENVTTLEYTLKPLVYKYVIRYHFDEGLHRVTESRGALAGMAESVYLTDGHTDDRGATLLYDIDKGDMFITETEKGSGLIYTVVCSFGAPGYPNDYYSRTDQTYGLSLEVRLVNGKSKMFDFDITEAIKRQPRGGVIDVYGIVVSEEDVAGEAGEFDVDVHGWDDFIDIPIM